MSGNNRNHKNNPKSKLDVSEIRDFIDVQKEKISVERSELDLKKQHIKNQADIAKQSLSIQEKLLEKAPTEKRKDRCQIFVFSAVCTLMLLVSPRSVCSISLRSF